MSFHFSDSVDRVPTGKTLVILIFYVYTNCIKGSVCARHLWLPLSVEVDERVSRKLLSVVTKGSLWPLLLRLTCFVINRI